MSADEFRQLALSFPGTTESVASGVPEYFVRNKNFAGMGLPEDERGAVYLTPEQQARYMKAHPHVFFLAKGPRGRKGWTIVDLPDADTEMMRAALLAAWRKVATKQLLQEYDNG